MLPATRPEVPVSTTPPAAHEARAANEVRPGAKLEQAEPVLLSGTQRWYHVLSWPASWVFLLLVVANRYGPERMGHPGPVLAAGAGLVLYFFFRHSGSFHLTPRRLRWTPRFGKPVEVPLESIASGGVSHRQAWGQVQVQGAQRVAVSHALHASELAAMVELHRQPLFLGRVGGQSPVSEVAHFEVWRSEESHAGGEPAEEGLAVVRPGYVAFLPAGRHAEVVRGLLGPAASGARVEVPVGLLVEQLRWLPEDDFDRHLEQAVRASGGVRWPASEVRHVTPRRREYHLMARGQVLAGRPDAEGHEALGRMARAVSP
jgi:hypothetical protein